MTNREANELYIAALEHWYTTEAHKWNEHRLQELAGVIEATFNDTEKQLFNECMAALHNIYEQEKHWLYWQGMLDGVETLKKLGVLH